MDERFRILDGLPIGNVTLDESANGSALEQLALVGAWNGHWQGEFQVTQAMLEQMRDFGNSRKIDTLIDYGHASIFDSSADAAGWIKPGDFSVKKKALWGKVQWNARALEKIQAKELRYKSPTIVFNTTDRKTGRMGGASLHSVALTNTPFLTELPEVRVNAILSALADTFREDHPMTEEQIKRLAGLLGLADNASAEDVITAAQRWASTQQALSQILGAGDPVAAVRQLQTKAAAADGAQARITELETKVATFEAKEADADALALVKKYQAERKVMADGTAHYIACLAQAKADPDGFKAMMEATQPWVAGGPPAKPGPTRTEANAKIDDTQRLLNEKMGVDDETFLKHNPDLA